MKPSNILLWLPLLVVTIGWWQALPLQLKLDGKYDSYFLQGFYQAQDDGQDPGRSTYLVVNVAVKGTKKDPQ